MVPNRTASSIKSSVNKIGTGVVLPAKSGNLKNDLDESIIVHLRRAQICTQDIDTAYIFTNPEQIFIKLLQRT